VLLLVRYTLRITATATSKAHTVVRPPRRPQYSATSQKANSKKKDTDNRVKGIRFELSLLRIVKCRHPKARLVNSLVVSCLLPVYAFTGLRKLATFLPCFRWGREYYSMFALMGFVSELGRRSFSPEGVAFRVGGPALRRGLYAITPKGAGLKQNCWNKSGSSAALDMIAGKSLHS
jgi:hypothetical protein